MLKGQVIQMPLEAKKEKELNRMAIIGEIVVRDDLLQNGLDPNCMCIICWNPV